ncbi:MAG: hypothetical protein CML06_10350 [Pseudomonadales bacterium]|nr:hypothetical protein [Pseudomonadales bacterium]
MCIITFYKIRPIGHYIKGAGYASASCFPHRINKMNQLYLAGAGRWPLLLVAMALIGSVLGCAGVNPYGSASAADRQSPPVSAEPTASPPREPVAAPAPGEPQTAASQTPAETPKAIPFTEVLRREQEQKARRTSPPVINPSTPLQPPPAAPRPEPAAPASEPEAELTSEPDTTQQAAPVTFTLEQLPITIGGHWILSANGQRCNLRSKPVPLADSAGGTQATLVVSTDQWRLDTGSDIDLSYPGTGLTLDSGRQFTFSGLQGATNVVIQAPPGELVQALSGAGSLQVALGFWPTWPQTETHSASIPIADFPRAYASWKLCQQRLNPN